MHVLQGTWEEVKEHDEELAGKQVTLIVAEPAAGSELNGDYKPGRFEKYIGAISSGRLHGRNAGTTVTLPDGSQPGDVFFNADGSKLVGTRVATSLIDSFTVGSDGQLTAAPGSPFAESIPTPERRGQSAEKR